MTKMLSNGLSSGELRGRPTPPSGAPAAGAWNGVVSLPLHGRQGWFLALLLLSNGLSSTLLGAGNPEASDGTALFWMLVPVAIVVPAFLAPWARRGGAVTIDPDRQELSWLRPVAGAEPKTWSMDRVTAQARRFSAWSDAVELTIGAERLLVRVPRGQAKAFSSAFHRGEAAEK